MKVLRKFMTCFISIVYLNFLFLYRRILLLLHSPMEKWIENKIVYYRKFGKVLNYKKPRNINEKAMWLTRYWQHPLKTFCADKYMVREYVKVKGLEEILIPLIAVYEQADQINFDALPTQFVLKCNHGSGYNIVCDKGNINESYVKKTLDRWLHEDFSERLNEIHYKNIDRRIICEKKIGGDEAPMEYQLWCLNGSPDSFLACRKKLSGEYEAWSYSLDWKRIYERKIEKNKEIPKPKNIDRMVAYAKILSSSFPFVRVDFYEVNGVLYFAELTFSPSANMMDNYKDEFLNRLGRKLVLPEKWN